MDSVLVEGLNSAVLNLHVMWLIQNRWITLLIHVGKLGNYHCSGYK